MDINFHGDELHYVGSGELGGKIGARAISHLELLSDEGIKAMLIRPTFAVLLPSTAHIMHLVPPPAKKIIAAGNLFLFFSLFYHYFSFFFFFF